MIPQAAPSMYSPRQNLDVLAEEDENADSRDQTERRDYSRRGEEMGGEEGEEDEYEDSDEDSDLWEREGEGEQRLPFLSVYDWVDRVQPQLDMYDGDNYMHVKKWWGGRGSLWKPITNMDRISRQEQRHTRRALKDDHDGTMLRLLSGYGGTLGTQSAPQPYTHTLNQRGFSRGGGAEDHFPAMPPGPPVQPPRLPPGLVPSPHTQMPGGLSVHPLYGQSPTLHHKNFSPSPPDTAPAYMPQGGGAQAGLDPYAPWDPNTPGGMAGVGGGYSPTRAYDGHGRKYPPLKNKLNRPPMPPNRLLQQQWGMPNAHRAPMRHLQEDTASNAGSTRSGKASNNMTALEKKKLAAKKARERNQKAIDWRIKSLPVIPVNSANGVGGLIHLQPLQARCGLNDLDHKFVTEDEVDRTIAEEGCNLDFLDNSGLANLCAMADQKGQAGIPPRGPSTSTHGPGGDANTPQPGQQAPKEDDRGVEHAMMLRKNSTAEKQLARTLLRQKHPWEGPVDIPGKPLVNPRGGVFHTSDRFPDVSI